MTAIRLEGDKIILARYIHTSPPTLGRPELNLSSRSSRCLFSSASRAFLASNSSLRDDIAGTRNFGRSMYACSGHLYVEEQA